MGKEYHEKCRNIISKFYVLLVLCESPGQVLYALLLVDSIWLFSAKYVRILSELLIPLFFESMITVRKSFFQGGAHGRDW